MSDKIKILILEDEKEDCDRFRQYAQTADDIEIIGCTGNANEAIRLAREFHPDAVIVDLELHKGGGNGLQFLSKIKQSGGAHCPFLLVTTNNPSHTIHEAARTLGADFILTKYEEGYSAEYVIDFLKMMYGTIHTSSKSNLFSVISGGQAAKPTIPSHETVAPSVVTHDQKPENEYYSLDDFSEIELLEYIREQMNEIGISPKAVGYGYLADSILIKLKDSDANVYSILGPKYKKSDPSIERAMQYAINRAWRTNDPAELLRIYTARIHSERGVPTIMEFIYFYVTKTRTYFKIR